MLILSSLNVNDFSYTVRNCKGLFINKFHYQSFNLLDNNSIFSVSNSNLRSHAAGAVRNTSYDMNPGGHPITPSHVMAGIAKGAVMPGLQGPAKTRDHMKVGVLEPKDQIRVATMIFEDSSQTMAPQ